MSCQVWPSEGLGSTPCNDREGLAEEKSELGLQRQTELGLSPNLSKQDNFSENNFSCIKDKLFGLSETQSVKEQL